MSEHEVRIFVEPSNRADSDAFWRVEAVGTKYEGTGLSLNEALDNLECAINHGPCAGNTTGCVPGNWR